MLEKIFTKSKCRRIRTKAFRCRDGSGETVTDRQERIPGFDQAALRGASVILVGCGGIGGMLGLGLAKKGLGHMRMFDRDVVEPSNLSRQLFLPADVHKNKAQQLAKNLAHHATSGTKFEAYKLNFEDAVAEGIELSANLVVCGVDNQKTRVNTSIFCRDAGIPCLFIAVDYVAESGYVFIQEPGKACFGCKFHKSLQGRKAPCRTPASIDILNVVCGLALYGIDSLLMDRGRDWNYRLIHLAGFVGSDQLNVARRPDCPLCGEARSQPQNR